jgi:hypothetical protein
VLFQIANVCGTAEKPQQFVQDTGDMQFFRCHHGKPIGEIKTHLVTEYTSCPGSGAIGFLGAIFEDMGEQLLIGLHASICTPELEVVQARRL